MKFETNFKEIWMKTVLEKFNCEQFKRNFRTTLKKFASNFKHVWEEFQRNLNPNNFREIWMRAILEKFDWEQF